MEIKELVELAKIIVRKLEMEFIWRGVGELQSIRAQQYQLYEFIDENK